MHEDFFRRSRLVLGDETMTKLSSVKVIIFGIGGVGSWCAEGLIRNGIQNLTIVDFDRISPSNINRQLMATSKTIGLTKVDVLKERLLEINPLANITSLRKIFTQETSAEFGLEGYDYIIDAVDSLKDKACLILEASKTDATLISSMGAALKVDPTKIKVDEFLKVKGCPLAAALRKKMRRGNALPEKPFLCVYGDEVLPNIGGNKLLEEEKHIEGKRQKEDELSITKAVTNGSLVHITAIFGFTICGLLIQKEMER